MSVSETELRHVAALARLALHDAEVRTLTDELNTILTHVQAIAGAADQQRHAAAAAPEMATAPGEMRRPDVVAPIALSRPLESFAPAVRDGFLLVPRLTTHEA